MSEMPMKVCHMPTMKCTGCGGTQWYIAIQFQQQLVRLKNINDEKWDKMVKLNEDFRNTARCVICSVRGPQAPKANAMWNQMAQQASKADSVGRTEYR